MQTPHFARKMLIAVALLAAWSLIAAAPAHTAGLRVGTGTAEFVSDNKMIIAGGIGGGTVQGQEGLLRAVAVVLEKPHHGRFAIVACDVLFVTGDMVQEAAAEIEKRCGIPADHLLVNATHTHGAPSTVRVHGYAPEPDFVRSVTDGIVQAVVQACDQLTDNCTLHFQLSQEHTVGQNSRLLLADNTIFWIGSRADAVRPTGPFDPELPILAFRGPDASLRALIFNHSTHTIGGLKPNVRSPAFYGLTAQALEADLQATVCFLEGASGSTHNLGTVTIPQAIERLSAAIRQGLAQAQPRPVDRLVAVRRRFTFKVRAFDEQVEDEKVLSYCRKRAPDHADAIAAVFRQMRLELKPEQGKSRCTQLHVMLLGDVALVGVPAEYFTSLGMEIKRRSPFPDTYIAELAGDWIGYLPDREGHELGGYQTWMGLHSYAEPGTGERIVDETVAMLEQLAAEK